MSEVFKINKPLEVWNTPSYLKEGMIVRASGFDMHKARWYIGNDDEGKNIFIDNSDIEQGLVEKCYDDYDDEEIDFDFFDEDDLPQFIILDPESVWKTPSFLKKDMVVTIESYDDYKMRWYIGKDDEGKDMFIDNGDIEQGYVEEY